MKNATGLVLILAALMAGGCQDPSDDGKMKLSLYPAAIQVKLPPVEKGQTPATPDCEAMSTVLSEIIVAGGNVDTARFDIFKAKLVKVLQSIANYGPSTEPAKFETLADKMAYWYNARALWAMYLAGAYGPKLHEYYLSTLHDSFYAIKFPVDGRMMTLKKIDDEIFKLGGYLALISAPCAMSGRAAIPEAAFGPKDFPAIIKSRFNDFIADRSRFHMDVMNMEIIVPRIIWQFRSKMMADYLQLYPTPDVTFNLVLASMTSELAQFRIKNAIGYKCVEATANQTLMVSGGNQTPTGFLGL